jgi:hypothetical protein
VLVNTATIMTDSFDSELANNIDLASIEVA